MAAHWRVSALCALMLLSGFGASAQFPINESFTGTTAPGFTLGGNATLTGTATTPGYLRLTSASTNQAGYAVLNGSFASPQGFSISFEFFSYGGTGADGLSVFLIDAAGTNPTVAGQFNIGAYGGSLGYAQKTAAGGATDINGVSKGYLGVGIDEFGNYSNPTEGRIGNTGAVANAVALRGPGTGLTGYAYLTGTGTLPFALSVPTARAQVGSDDYRKAYIYVVAANGAYNVTVRIQHGTTITTTTDSYPIATPPANLRIGFAGSTGGSTNIHEIRNLAIVNNPYAVDDFGGTVYNNFTPLTLNVVANDQGVGAAINPSTVDLDPNTAGTQTSFTVAGQGTFTVNNQGVVSFVPSGTYAGVVSTPYVVRDLLNQVSNPAIISVLVRGADLASSVNGPASANPGSQVTYTVNTTNIGTETATNVSPTLQLPTGLNIPNTASYTYVSGTGLVTFNQTTLAMNGSISNSVTFTVPASGTTSIPATSGFVYPTGAVVPDPTVGNNSATITTAITGLATIATGCATPGKDGPVTLTATSTPNTYYPGLSVATANGVSAITVGTATGSTPVAAGDLVLVMQMQGVAINPTPTDVNYGSMDPSTLAAGLYEYANVASVSGSVITLDRTLTNTYTTSTSVPVQNFQVIRVPQYSALTVSGIVTGTAWNSQTKIGGVLALDVAGTTTFSGTTPGLNMTAKGFSGGGGQSYAGPAPTGTNSSYNATVASGAHGAKGEGIAGTPRYTYNGTSVTDNTAEGYPVGSNNRGAPANAGGGAQDFTPATNSGNSGGGGGGNGVAGGIGGYGFGSGGSGNQAGGGRAVSVSATRLLMGGGGGAGSNNNGATAAINSSGGVGGGVIILRTGTVSGTSLLQADGGDGVLTGSNTQLLGGGGGGAGGTVLVLANAGLANVTVSATGGNGSNVDNVNGGVAYGPGGGGSGGQVYANAALNAATTVAGGTNGQTNNGGGNRRTNFGAASGGTGVVTTNIAADNTPTIGGAGSCLPTLAVSLSTATPNVVRDNGNLSGTPLPATYKAIISNTGGVAFNTSTTLTLDPLFTYISTQTPSLTLTSANGTVTTPAYTLSGGGTSTPVFSGITIPGGATLSISFRAAIAKSAVNGTAYQASGSVTFTDPARTTATGTTTPGATLTGSTGTVPGSNYAAASSTVEDVTVVAPLPVELTRFEAAAVRQDALLTWATASEKNNDHFVVERSFDGSTFAAVGTVRGQGSTTRATEYRFTDAGVGHLAQGTVYYRLQQVDADGTPSFGPMRQVLFGKGQAAVSLYPNPSQENATLDLRGLAAGSYQVQVVDLAGRVLRKQQFEAVAAPLDLQGLPQGAYVVLVQGAGISKALPLIRR